MKAIYFHQTLSLRDVPAPAAPENGEALVRVRLAGICNTDLEITAGYMGFRGVLGHEFVGDVVDSPGGSLVGKRVVGEINAGCGACSWCRSGLPRHCPNRTVLGILNRDGVFAEFVSLPLGNLRPVPEDLSDEKAVFVEPLAAAMEILEQLHLQPWQSVAVFGDGKLGLLIAFVLRLTGCEVTLIGKHREKLDIAEPLGVITQHLEGVEDQQFDVVVEATGSPEGLALAVQHTRPRGTVVLKTTSHAPVNYNPAPLVINEITLLGSRCGKFEPAIRHLERGTIDTRPLIQRVFHLEEAMEAFEAAARPGALKILLKMP